MMDTRDLHDKGLKLRREMFGREAVEQRTNAFGAFGEPLQTVINAYAYGDIWSRPGLPLKTKSLAAVAMTAAIGRASELRVHVNGALTNGCTAEEIREILLLVALYCGIPAASRTAFQRANSRTMCSPKASGVEPRTRTPAVVKRFCTTSSPRLSLIALFSSAMISGGTPRGANTPYQVVTS